MDLTPTEDQQQILDAVGVLLERHAGHKRNMELLPDVAYDTELESKLFDAGFMDVARGDETGPLDAGLIAYEVARAAGTVSYSASALVAPMVLGETVEGPVAITRNKAGIPVRYGPHARTVLIDAGEEALRLSVGPNDWDFVNNDNAGYSLASLPANVMARAESLGKGSGERLRNWWRVALAIETAATMKGSVDTTVNYVRERVQFGRPIGAFQTVQHRLAECTVLAEGARWLGLYAAYMGAPATEAATAASYATSSALRIFTESHQLHGAMGFTREYHLHVWSMRLPALRQEMGGPATHQSDVTDLRFNSQEIAARHAAYAV